MAAMNRRELMRSLLGTVASYSLLRTLFASDAFAGPVRPVAHGWLREVNDLCRDLKADRIAPALWQAKLRELYDRVELGELLAAVDFAKLAEGFEYPDLGVSTRMVDLPRLDGVPKDLAFLGKVFGMRRDRAIIPHGHRNMASCHYVLQGALRLRQYDKVEDTSTHMVLAPTVDETARPGSHSSISDEKDNVHWLVAETETAFTFDVIVLDLKGEWDVENVDPEGADKLPGGRLRVRKLGVDEALKKYGHDTHHGDLPPRPA